MRPYMGLWVSSWLLLGGGLLFYVLAVAGAFFPRATPWNDVGLYSTTVVLVGLGLGGLLLRHAKLRPRGA
jgi:hypothetical protein